MCRKVEASRRLLPTFKKQIWIYNSWRSFVMKLKKTVSSWVWVNVWENTLYNLFWNYNLNLSLPPTWNQCKIWTQDTDISKYFKVPRGLLGGCPHQEWRPSGQVALPLEKSLSKGGDGRRELSWHRGVPRRGPFQKWAHVERNLVSEGQAKSWDEMGLWTVALVECIRPSAGEAWQHEPGRIPGLLCIFL